MKHNIKKIVSFVLVTLVLSSWSQAGELPKTADLFPPETVAVLEVGNFSELRSQFEKTTFYKFYKEPAMSAFFEDVKTKWREKNKENDNDIFKAITNSEVLPQGRIAFGLVLNEKAKSEGEPIALFISQWGENIGKIKEAIEKTVTKATEEGIHKKSEDYRGHKIISLVSEESSRLGHGFLSGLSYSIIDDCLIGSEDIELLKFTIAHIEGATSPTLASNSDYNSAVKAVGPYHDIKIYVNIQQIIRTATSGDSTGRDQMMVANLGFDNVRSFAGAVGLGREAGSSFAAKGLLKIDGTKKGICKMLEAESAPVKVPKFIPSSSYALTFFNLNIKKAYAELGTILSGINPMFASMLYIPIVPPSPDGAPGVQLHTDIIDHLGSGIIVSQNINKPFSTESTPTEYLIALAVTNRGALEKSVSEVHSKVLAAGKKDATREIEGYTIYLVDMRNIMPFISGGMVPLESPYGSESTVQFPKFAIAITDTHLLFGVESVVERAIRTLADPKSTSLSSAKWFSATKSAMPSAVGLASFEDGSASMELLWWMVKESAKTKKTGGMPGSYNSMAFGIMAFNEFFNADLLPNFEVVRKYFGFGASYAQSKPEGYYFELKDIDSAGR